MALDLERAVERALRIVRFEAGAIRETADDETALQPGLLIVALAGVAQGLGGRHFLLAFLAYPFAQIVGSFLGAGVLFLVGLLFQPRRWDFFRLYRVLAHVSILGWLALLGIVHASLGLLASVVVLLWSIPLTVYAVEVSGECDRGRAILIVAIPLILCCAAVGIAVFAAGAAAVLAILGLAAASAP